MIEDISKKGWFVISFYSKYGIKVHIKPALVENQVVVNCGKGGLVCITLVS